MKNHDANNLSDSDPKVHIWAQTPRDGFGGSEPHTGENRERIKQIADMSTSSEVCPKPTLAQTSESNADSVQGSNEQAWKDAAWKAERAQWWKLRWTRSMGALAAASVALAVVGTWSWSSLWGW